MMFDVPSVLLWQRSDVRIGREPYSLLCARCPQTPVPSTLELEWLSLESSAFYHNVQNVLGGARKVPGGGGGIKFNCV